MTTIRRISTTLAATALLGASAVPALGQSGDYPTDSSNSTSTQSTVKAKKHKKGKRGDRRLPDAQLTKVATALGTDLASLKAAMASVKTKVDATDARETKAERDALLAEELGVSVDALRSAFSSVRGTTDGHCKGKPAGGTSGPTSGDYPSDTTTTTSGT